jgi:signal transduction histidine kinase
MAKQAYQSERPTGDRDRISSTFPKNGAPGAELAYALHDARNILAIIGSNVNWLRGWVSPEVAEVVDDVAVATVRLHALLESALARTDPADAHAGLSYQLVRVTELVRNATVGFRHPPRGIRIEATLRGEDLVEVDAELVTRVLANLVDNAVRYSPDAGVVAIDADVGGGRFALAVSDQGAGIAPERHETIFRPGVSGAIHGLGLAFCRRVTLQHGGTVEIVPSSSGAHFVVVLPSQPQ